MPAQEFTGIGSEGVIGMMFQSMQEQQEASWVNKIANSFSSTQATETYEGIGTVPQMREWLGGKNAKSFTAQSLSISNKDWESTIRINKKDLRRDKTGFLQAKINLLMQRALTHDMSRLSTLIETGDATTNGSCFDSAALFASHSAIGSSGTIDNQIDSDISTHPVATAGTTTNPSVAEFHYAVLDGVKTLKSFKDDAGEPINEFARNFLVMVPNGLYKAAIQALTADRIDGGITNVLTQSNNLNFEVVVNPRLTWTDKFAVFITDNPFKSLIVQLESPLVFKALADGSDYEFNENAHLYSVEKSGNVGYGRFDQCVEVTMT